MRDIVRLFPRGDGSLWVLSSRGDTQIPSGVVAVFDEFDRAGVFVRSITVQGPRRPRIDEFYLVDDFVFLVTNGAEGNMTSTGSVTDGEIDILCLRMGGVR